MQQIIFVGFRFPLLPSKGNHADSRRNICKLVRSAPVATSLSVLSSREKQLRGLPRSSQRANHKVVTRERVVVRGLKLMFQILGYA